MFEQVIPGAQSSKAPRPGPSGETEDPREELYQGSVIQLQGTDLQSPGSLVRLKVEVIIGNLIGAHQPTPSKQLPAHGFTEHGHPPSSMPTPGRWHR